MDISVQSNLRQVQRQFGAFIDKQLPFATATALTALGKHVQADEKKQFNRVLDRPTPFTLNAVGVKAARKSDLRAVVYVKDKAAGYLAPYESGDVQKVNGRAVLNPKASPVNQYGNLPRNLIARLKGRTDVFIGPVKTKGGEVINGCMATGHTCAAQRQGAGQFKAGTRLQHVGRAQAAGAVHRSAADDQAPWLPLHGQGQYRAELSSRVHSRPGARHGHGALTAGRNCLMDVQRVPPGGLCTTGIARRDLALRQKLF